MTPVRLPQKKFALLYALVLYLNAVPVMLAGWYIDYESIEAWITGFVALWVPAFILWQCIVMWAFGISRIQAGRGRILTNVRHFASATGAMFVSMMLFLIALLGSTEILRVLIERLTQKFAL